MRTWPLVLVLVAGCVRAPAKSGDGSDAAVGGDGTGGDDGGAGSGGGGGGGAGGGGGGGASDGGSGDGGTALDPAVWHAHADAALSTMLLRYWSPSAKYLLANAPSSDGA